LKTIPVKNFLSSFLPRPYRDVLFVSEGIHWVTEGETRCLTEDVLQKLNISYRFSDPVRVGFARQAVFYPSVYFLEYPRLYLLPKTRIAFPYYHGYPHTSTSNPLMVKCYNNLKKYHQRISRIQTSHCYMRDLILQTGIDPAKVFLIPIAIKDEYFSVQTAELKKAARENYGVPQNAVVIGSFQKDGNGWGEGLDPKMVKGPDVFLKTVAILRQSVPEFFVLLSGPARGYVKKGLEELKIPYKHIYLDDYSKICSLYHCLDVYLVTSRQEGGPRAVLESMAAGVPLVTTRVGQAMDLVRNEQNGMMVNVEDVDALAFACLRVLQDSRLREKIIRNAAQTVKANTYSAYIPLWRKFFTGFVDFNEGR
jgi:glycosyltransferase involved in cell wall biosynthesis